MKPEDYQKYAIKTKVYRGGITRRVNGEQQQFEFIADAYSGSVIDIYPLPKMNPSNIKKTGDRSPVF